MPHRAKVFLLSPANCSGKRARLLLSGDGRSELATRLREGEGASIGEVFTFVSGLYFRGKLAYASAFANAPAGCSGVQVIVPGLGLRSPGERVDAAALRAIARVRVDPTDARFVGPLQRDAAVVADGLGPGGFAVLLGSIATQKYVRPLGKVLSRRLRVPREIIGVGEMSRGSLLLRRAEEGPELTYVECPTLVEDGARAP